MTLFKTQAAEREMKCVWCWFSYSFQMILSSYRRTSVTRSFRTHPEEELSLLVLKLLQVTQSFLEVTVDQTAVESQQRLSSFGGVVGGVGGSGLRLSCYQRLRCSSDTLSQSEPDLRTGRSEWEVQSLYSLGDTLSVTLIVSQLQEEDEERAGFRSESGSTVTHEILQHKQMFVPVQDELWPFNLFSYSVWWLHDWVTVMWSLYLKSPIIRLTLMSPGRKQAAVSPHVWDIKLLSDYIQAITRNNTQS